MTKKQKILHYFIPTYNTHDIDIFVCYCYLLMRKNKQLCDSIIFLSFLYSITLLFNIQRYSIHISFYNKHVFFSLSIHSQRTHTHTENDTLYYYFYTYIKKKRKKKEGEKNEQISNQSKYDRLIFVFEL